MSHHRLLSGAVLSTALLCLIGLAACMVEARDPVDTVPGYPGAQTGPGYRRQDGTTLRVKQIYYTDHPYARVLEFYERYMGDDPAWEGTRGGGLTVWKNNMNPESMLTEAAPLDHMRPGKLIVVMDEGTRVVIRAFSSHPGDSGGGHSGG